MAAEALAIARAWRRSRSRRPRDWRWALGASIVEYGLMLLELNWRINPIRVTMENLGLSRPDSDYDLLVVVPDDIRPDVRAYLMDEVHRTVKAAGTVPDHDYLTESSWQNPDSGSRILVEDAKRCGIEVPQL